MSYLDKKVSIFNNYWDANPIHHVRLKTFLTSISHKLTVDRIRTIHDKKQRNKLKASLPAITPSGLFKTKRAAANLIEHSGLIQLDIDGQDNKNLSVEGIKAILRELPIVVFSGLSVSGTGVFALVPIAYPEQHREHFLALEQHLLEWYNIVIDSSCKDVCRLRGYSYDSDYYINEDAIIYKDIFESPTTNYSNNQALSPNYFSPDDKFRKAMEIIIMYQVDITGDYPQWFSIICGIANEFGEQGRPIAHAISMFSPKYDEDNCDMVYTNALQYRYKYSIATFYHYFNDHNGIRAP